jgi:L-asparagine oxygenase
MMQQPTTTATGLDPVEHRLSEDDAGRLMRLADQARWRFGRPDAPALVEQAPLLVRDLPDDLLLFLRRFVRNEPAGAAVIRGCGLDDAALGPTPDRYNPPDPSEASQTWGFYLTLLGYALGEPFAWSNLQDGRPVHNVLPVPGDEQEKTGTSSASVLEPHTEDAAHPARADYLGLLCLRNDDKVPTVYSSLTRTTLDPAAVQVLMQPRFTILVEEAHAGTLGETRQVPVLFGHPDRPYIAYDGLYLSGRDQEATEALAHLTEQLEAVAVDVLLEPGDLVWIDNFDAVHSRRSFPARYDSRDRWLLRQHVTRDLRRSRPWRTSPGSAVIDVHAHSS